MLPVAPSLTSENLLALASVLKTKYGVTSRISLSELARRLGIEIISLNFSTNSIYGYAEPVDGTWYIGLNQTFSHAEWELTLAHELAHAWLGIHDENLAESFGAELMWDKRLSLFRRLLEDAAKDGDLHTMTLWLFPVAARLCTLEHHLLDPRKKRTVHEAKVLIGLVVLASLILDSIESTQRPAVLEGAWWTQNLFPAGSTPASPAVTN